MYKEPDSSHSLYREHLAIGPFQHPIKRLIERSSIARKLLCKLTGCLLIPLKMCQVPVNSKEIGLFKRTILAILQLRNLWGHTTKNLKDYWHKTECLQTLFLYMTRNATKHTFRTRHMAAMFEKMQTFVSDNLTLSHWGRVTHICSLD